MNSVSLGLEVPEEPSAEDHQPFSVPLSHRNPNGTHQGTSRDSDGDHDGLGETPVGDTGVSADLEGETLLSIEDNGQIQKASWGGRRAGAGRKPKTRGGGERPRRKQGSLHKAKSHMRRKYSEIRAAVTRSSGSTITQQESRLVLRCLSTLVVDRDFTPTEAVRESSQLLGLSQKTVWRILKTMADEGQVLETDASNRGQCVDERADKRVKVPREVYGQIEEWKHDCQSKSMEVTGKSLQEFLRDHADIHITERSGRRLLERLMVFE